MFCHITVAGTYSQRESRHVSSNWSQICADHEQEFPQIRECCRGTFNVVLAKAYVPPDEAALRQKAKHRGLSVRRYDDGNYISPYAKVVKMNEAAIEAWIYRGGHGSRPVLELLSRMMLSEVFNLADGAPVTLTIEEGPAGRPGMPAFPPELPGKLA